MKDDLIELRGANFVRPRYVVTIRTIPAFHYGGTISEPAKIYVDLKNNTNINIVCNDDTDMYKYAKEIRKIIK